MESFCYANTDFSVDNTFIERFSVGFEVNEQNSKKIYFIKYRIRIKVDYSLINFFDITQTGDRFENKVCDRCYKFLSTNFFSDNRRKKDNIITKRPSCKDCRKVKDGVGIPQKEREIWNAKKPKQGELFHCPICEKYSISGISKIVIDHNHDNGSVRGFICESCNTGIGRFDDDPKILEKAISWLKRSN
tara:strand:+ start:285 stop:851 length:567 start_codon:yes stop_codon:yes gene_type:complete